MSLVGNLADLGLGDILQIISLSQKSGTLQLATASDIGAIGFVQGKVVMAVREQGEVAVSELLIQNQLATASQVHEMMKLQQQKPHGAQSQPPGLWEANNISIDQVEETMKAQIEQLVYEMFDWEEGNFSFVVAEDVQEVSRLSLASNRFCVMRGLNPQWLAMEGARLRDERQRNDPFASFMAKSQGAAKEKPPTPEVAPPPELELPLIEAPPEPPVEKPLPPEPQKPAVKVVEPKAERQGLEIVLIDDDPNILRALREKLISVVPSLSVFTKVDAGLKRTRELLWANKRVVVISDLILPRSDGAGILGGLEVLEKVRPDYPDVPVYLLTDYPNDEAKERAQKLQVTGFVQKPRRADLEKDKGLGALDGTVATLMQALEPLLAQAQAVPEPAAEAPSAEEIDKTERMEPIERTRSIDDLGSEDTVASAPVVTRHEPVARSLPAPLASVEEPTAAVAADADDLPELAVEPLEPFEAASIPPIEPQVAERANQIAAANAEPSDLIDLSVEIGLELSSKPETGPQSEQERTMVVLKSLLFELMSPSSRDTIMLLVLRYASELFSRAALLLVARDELWGLGGFAHGVKNVDFIALTRKLRLKFDTGSVFETVVRQKASERHALKATSAERSLAERLSIDPERPVFIAPLISADRVAAILLGDNHQLGNDLGDTHGLEIFLLQAGMAMERALLERRLRELARRDGGGGVGTGER